MSNRASFTIWEGNGFVVAIDGKVIGGTMPEHDARAVVRWLDDGGDTLIPVEREKPSTAAVLSAEELAALRQRADECDFADLDLGAALDHIDYLTDAYEQLVRRSAEEADRAQALVLHKDEQLAAHDDLHRQAAHRIEQLVRERRRVEACLRAVEAERDQLRNRLKATEGERDRAVSRLVAVTNATGASL